MANVFILIGIVKLSPDWADLVHEKYKIAVSRTSISAGDHRSRRVWLYHRFCLSYRDLENLLAERGIDVSYE